MGHPKPFAGCALLLSPKIDSAGLSMGKEKKKAWRTCHRGMAHTSKGDRQQGFRKSAHNTKHEAASIFVYWVCVMSVCFDAGYVLGSMISRCFM